MTTADFLSYLRSLDVKVWVENGEVIFNAPKGVLTPVLRAELTERKAKILAFLHSVAGATRFAESPLQGISRDGKLPPSFAQERLWFLDQLESGNSTYNVPIAIGLAGPLNVAALERSVNEIVRRHEALRTSFAVVNGQLAQVIAPAAPLRLALVDLQGIPGAGREAEARRLATEEAQWPFDLARGPLLRARLLRLGKEDHVLLLPMHHIVSDGWSVGVLFRELSVLYENFSSGKPSPLPELPIQYADFAVWQRQWLQGEVLEGQLSYWKKQLAGAPAVLDLPSDRPRSPVQTFHGARQSVVLSQALTNRLKALSHRENVTLFVTLLAAFQTLLHRYTSHDDIVVGSPIAGRTRTEIEGLIGLFVNTLALRTDLSGDPSFRELLGRVREVALEAFAHQDLPFEKLVEELQPERDLSRSPLLQVMFVLQNAPMTPLRLSGLTVTPLRVESQTAKFDLTLSMAEKADTLTASIEFSTDLFDAATIRRMLGHFQRLLEGIVANPEQRLSDLPILTDAEKQQLLVEWNDTAVALPAERCMHELVAEQAARTPDAIAVDSSSRELSYGELDRRANQLAHALRKRGVGPDVLVGLYVNRTPDMIVALFGVLKAGGAYVPLDPDYPAERVAFMLEDCGAKALVTEESLRAALPALPAFCEVIYLDRDAAALAAERQDAPRSEVGLSQLAYAIYTSGSTGQPKATLVTHRGLLNLAVSEKRLYGIGPHSRVLQFASLSFDTSLSEIAMALCSGATLYVEGREGILGGAYLERYLEGEKITVLSLTPSALATLDPTVAPSLEQIIVGGEACPVELAARWAGRCRFFNAYGPTEATITTTCVEYRDGALPPLIGRPLPNVRVYLLDLALEPVPVGVAGELYIGGIGVARGYLNRPQLTAERFLPDPFHEMPGALMYRSGDFARWRSDGQIEFIGRIDDQVRIRGFRIELGEIEAVLARHPQVQACAVIVREDTPGERRLVAYLVPGKGEAPTVGALREYLRRSLPDYMVPAAFVVMEALPLTPNDKVDRKALPAPDGSRPELDQVNVLPRTDDEKRMARIFCDVLGLDRVGVFDNFFDLGGHSLAAVRLMSRLRAESGFEFPLRILFERPTVAGLAEAIVGLSWVAKSKAPNYGAGKREEIEL